MIKNIIKIALGAGVLLFTAAGCTDNFEKLNTNQYQIHNADAPTLLQSLIEGLVNIQENDSQMMDQMVGQLGGYFVCSNTWSGANFSTFNQSDNWNSIPWENSFKNVYGNYFKIKKATKSSGHYYAFATLMRAMSMLRVTDIYGPMPYTQVRDGNFYTPYDSEIAVYEAILADLEFAATTLYSYHVESSGHAPLGSKDPVFSGDYSKWAMLANSMRLRVAMRLSTEYPEVAQVNAEKAAAHEAGTLEANGDNAMLSVGGKNNPYHLASVSWGDLRVNANIVDYMKGYKDPRATQYFEYSTFTGISKEYIGMRIGEATFDKKSVSGYSVPKFTEKSSLMIFCAAETAFLKAEAKLRGWNVGSESAQAYYEKGIKLSMDQHGVSMPGDYLTSTNTPVGHENDPRGAKYNYSLESVVTAGWNAADTFEKNLQRIITQKWIANYPLGIEAWAEYRRTGYPELYPVIDNLSPSLVDSKRGMRRLRYPYTEVQNNKVNYQDALNFLKGPDTEATDLGWGKKK